MGTELLLVFLMSDWEGGDLKTVLQIFSIW